MLIHERSRPDGTLAREGRQARGDAMGSRRWPRGVTITDGPFTESKELTGSGGPAVRPPHERHAARTG